MNLIQFNGQITFETGRVYLAICLLIIFCVYLTPALADEGDLYLGGGPTLSLLDPDTGNTLFSAYDDTDIGGKLVLGYDLTKHWSVEAFYSIPGEADMSPQGTIKYDALYGLGGIFSWPHNQQGPSGFLKAGAARLEAESAIILLEEENEEQFFLGTGGRYNFSQGWGLRLEYEHFSDDVQLITLSIVKRFAVRY